MRSAIIGHTKDMNLHSSIDKYKGHDAMTWSNDDDDKSLWEISQCLAITVTFFTDLMETFQYREPNVL